MLNTERREKLKTLIREQKIKATWLPLDTTKAGKKRGSALFHSMKKEDCTDGVHVGLESLVNHYGQYDIVVMQPDEEIYYHLLKGRLEQKGVFVLSNKDNDVGSGAWDKVPEHFLNWLLDDRRSIFLIRHHILRNSFKKRTKVIKQKV